MHNALDRMTRDPGPASASAERQIARMRDGRDRLDQALENLAQLLEDSLAEDPDGERGEDPGAGAMDQPIEMLAVIAGLIDAELADGRELYATLSRARSRPDVLDDATVHRVIRIYREKQDMHGDYELQLDRWPRWSSPPPSCAT